MMITGHLTLLVTSLGLARAGLLGAGTGEGSCAAPPFRSVLLYLTLHRWRWQLSKYKNIYAMNTK